MVSAQPRHACITFNSRIDTVHALKELETTGFPMEQVSVVPKDPDHEEQFYDADIADIGVRVGEKCPDRNATFGTITGSMLGAVGGCLVGFGLLAVPGIGPFVAIGISGKVLITTLAGAGIGAVSSGLIETLTGSEMTKDRVGVYRDRCSLCKYLVVVEGTEQEVRRAKYILEECLNSHHLHSG